MVSAESRVKLHSGHDEHGIVADLCVDLVLCLHTILISSRAVPALLWFSFTRWETLAHLNMPQWR